MRIRPYLLLCILTLAFAAADPSAVQAADYYVCDCAAGADGDCYAGDDAADGSSPDTPWRSYEKARTAFSTLAAGDSIRFCRGGVFEVGAQTRWVNDNCRADNPCVVRDYVPAWQSGNEADPMIRQTGDGNGFSLENGGAARHQEGYHLENLDVVGPYADEAFGNAIFLYNDIDDVVIERVTARGFTVGIQVAAANPCSAEPECDGLNDRTILRDSTIKDNELMGWIGSGNGLEITGSYFEGNGSNERFDHNIYIADNPGTTTGVRVIGNRLYRNARDASGRCASASLVVHGVFNDLVIEGNEIWEDLGAADPSCWGIAVDHGHPNAESFSNVIIRGNTVRNVGNVGIGMSSCASCTIENNQIIHEQLHGTRAIAVPDRAAGPGDGELDDIIVRNNSIYIGESSGASTGIVVGGEGDDHQIVSNAIRYDGTSDQWNCIAADLPLASYDIVDHNICFYPNAGDGAEWANDYGSLSAWRTASGLDAASASTDPGFHSPATPKWDLTAGRKLVAMVNAGHTTLSAPNEIDGHPRDAMPDVGAFEWGSAEGCPDAYLSKARRIMRRAARRRARHDGDD